MPAGGTHATIHTPAKVRGSRSRRDDGAQTRHSSAQCVNSARQHSEQQHHPRPESHRSTSRASLGVRRVRRRPSISRVPAVVGVQPARGIESPPPFARAPNQYYTPPSDHVCALMASTLFASRFSYRVAPGRSESSTRIGRMRFRIIAARNPWRRRMALVTLSRARGTIKLSACRQ